MKKLADKLPAINVQKTALVVMDYQHAILKSLNQPEALLTKASETIRMVRGYGVRVAYVRVAFDDADFASFPETSGMRVHALKGRHIFHKNALEAAIHPTVAPKPGDIIVRKTRMGAFSTTNLDERLRENGIHTLLLAGISTGGVVLSTVREGYDRDYRIFVLQDICADSDPDVHTFLTGRIFPQQTHVIQTEQLKPLFKR
jgi:nicotinamidase-related amidase